MNRPIVYIYGMPIGQIDDSVYGGLYGNATRSVGLAFNLAKLGHQVFLEVNEDFDQSIRPDLLPAGLEFIRPQDRDQFLNKADCLLISCTNLESFHKFFDREPYLEHRCRVIASCFDLGQKVFARRLKKSTKCITFNNEIQKQMWDQRRTGIQAFEVPYGVNERSYVDDAIQDVADPSAIWIGEIRRRDVLQRIVRFAEVNVSCKVTVVTRKIFDSSLDAHERGSVGNPYADFTGRDPVEKFNEIVVELCGIGVPSNLRFLGPVEGQNHVIQGQHTIGLDFSRFPAQTHDNTKVLDYLRSGLCVICDRGTPSYRFVKDAGHGVIVSPEFTDDEIRTAFEDCVSLSSATNRRAVASYVRSKYGWDVIALKFSEILCNATASKRWNWWNTIASLGRKRRSP